MLFRSEISKLLGGETNDGLVTLSHQQLPALSCLDTIKENKIMNNLEVKEYQELNHATMDCIDAPKDRDGSNAKMYANDTVIKWLGK